ncbi:MAG: hypothetical protein DLM72_09955 [Candidatus Nitrosopolaris wilkensis]|nr:MAG: hypothetical protein DLM72_09955 [Candidatus Nitrosopolaris wilkensis]
MVRIELDLVNKFSDFWTPNYTTENLKQRLGTVVYQLKNDEGQTVEGRKYYDLARYLKHRIPVYRPTPEFIINLSDLTEKLVKELHELDGDTRDFVLTQAVGRIFEDIHAPYHCSISRLLRVRLEP